MDRSIREETSRVSASPCLVVWIGGLVLQEGLSIYPQQEPGTRSNPYPNHQSEPSIRSCLTKSSELLVSRHRHGNPAPVRFIIPPGKKSKTETRPLSHLKNDPKSQAEPEGFPSAKPWSPRRSKRGPRGTVRVEVRSSSSTSRCSASQAFQQAVCASPRSHPIRPAPARSSF